MTTERAIHTLHWDDLGSVGGSQRFVVVPGPVDHDACLHDAGFWEFADSNERWDVEFKAMASRIVEALGTFGVPIVRERVAPGRTQRAFAWLRRWFGEKPVQTLLERIVETATSDQFPERVIEFGHDAAARLSVSDGHPIFWLEVPVNSGGLEFVLEAAAEGRLVRRTELHWERLQPRKLESD